MDQQPLLEANNAPASHAREVQASKSEPAAENSPQPESEAKLRAEQEADAKLQADVLLGTPNIYVSVLVAEFGGVDIRLNSSTKVKVHPFVLLLLSLPLFSAQLSILLFLRVSAIHTFFIDNQMRMNLHLDTPDGKVKVLMIAIASITNFEGLVVTVQHLAFIANPITWVEVARPPPEQWVGKNFPRLNWFVDMPLFVPCAFVAAMMNLVVTYTICTDVANVVIGSEDGKDAIFNCLALAFVSDLGASWWAFVSYILHIEPIDAFEFSLAENVWEIDSDVLTKEAEAKVRMPRIANLLVWLTGKKMGLEYSFLRTGHGARRFVHTLSVLGVVYVYLRQVFVILRAISWRFIPAVPDLCQQNEILHHGWARWLGDNLLAISMDTMYVELDTTTGEAWNGRTFSQYCEAPPTVLPLAFNDVRGCFTQTPPNEHLAAACPDYGPRASICIMLIVFAFMLVPTFASLLHGFFSKKRIAPVQMEEEGKGANTEELEASAAMPATFQARMADLEERLAKLEKQAT